MNGGDVKRTGMKKKMIHKTREMLPIFVYLALFFCSFTTYRRLVSDEFGISYFHYGFALAKAFVLAKVILLGRHVRFTRIFDDRPLIFPALYKVVVFSFFILAFDVFEHIVGGFFHGKDLAGVCEEIVSAGRDEFLARSLVVLFAFVPFFAFDEIGRVLGEGRLRAMFLKARATSKTDLFGG
jgi:hypothetical protein